MAEGLGCAFEDLFLLMTWHVGFSLPGGGGVNRAPQNVGGFGKRAQLTGTINQFFEH